MACFVLQLIAQICIKTERTKIATMALRKALKLNPFMWQAYADLCHLGDQPDASSIFQINNTDIFNTCQGNANTNSMILFGSQHSYDSCIGGGGGGGGGGIHNQSSNHNSSAADGGFISQLNYSSNYILSTPIEQQIHGPNNNGLQALQNLTTPINNNNNNTNLNSSLSMLRGNGSAVGINQQQQNTNSNLVFYDTPVRYSISTADPIVSGSNTAGSGIGGVQQFVDGGAGTPFRKQFKYLSTISPTTPSFGVLPLSSPCGADSSFFGSIGGGAGHTQTNLNITNSPLQPTLAELNQEQKVLGTKKIKGHVSSLINRKDTSANSGGGCGSKPAVFTQTGNITPRTPNNGGGVSSGTYIIY